VNILRRMKQHHTERKLSLKVMDRIDTMKKEEKEKVKQGKKEYFLKTSAKKNIMAEEKYVVDVVVYDVVMLASSFSHPFHTFFCAI
jgi:hypothetical protein